MTTYRLDDLGRHPSAMGRRCSFATATGTTWRGILCGHWETHKSDPGKHGVRLRLSGGSYRTVEHLAGDTVITIYPKEAP